MQKKALVFSCAFLFCALFSSCGQKEADELGSTPSGTISFPELIDAYPEASATTEISENHAVVVAEIPSSPASADHDPQAASCESGAVCQIISAELPSGSVVDGPVEHWAREVGAPEWVRLVRRGSIRDLAGRAGSTPIGPVEAEYEGFENLAITSVFQTLNCAVENGHRPKWLVKSWDRQRPVEIKLRFKLNPCG